MLQDEYKQRNKLRLLSQRVLKDTALLTGAAYLMDGVDTAVQSVRGTVSTGG